MLINSEVKMNGRIKSSCMTIEEGSNSERKDGNDFLARFLPKNLVYDPNGITVVRRGALL